MDDSDAPLPWEADYTPLPALLDALNRRLAPYGACAHVGTDDGRTWQATVQAPGSREPLDGWPAGGGDEPADAAEALACALDARAATLAALQAAHPHGVTVPSPEAFDDAARVA